MANLFQKIFMSKQERQLLDSMKNHKIEYALNDDVAHMCGTMTYTIDTDDFRVKSSHDWHFAQGDNYTLTVVQNGITSRFLSQKFARKMFLRMQNNYNKKMTTR